MQVRAFERYIPLMCILFKPMMRILNKAISVHL